MKTDPVAQHSSAPITAAFVAAQQELENPKYDSVNPHFRNRYASLSAIRKAVIPVFAKHGITVMQNITTSETSVSCVTVFRHGSGESFVFGPLILPVSKLDAQGFGSAITYACRYGLASSAGVAGEEDDDGEAACNTPAVQAKPLVKKQVVDESAAQRLSEKITDSGIEPGAVQRFLALKKAWPQGCQRIEDLPAKIADRIMNPEVWTTVLSFIQTEGSPDGQK